MAVAAGLRLSEAIGLRWSAVDLEARTLRVDVQLAREGGGFVLVEPKSAAGRRTVELPAFAGDALRAHRVRQLEERLAVGEAWRNDLDLVFVGELGQPLQRANTLRWFQRVLRREGLPALDFKTLRHTRPACCTPRAPVRKTCKRHSGTRMCG